MQYLGRFMAVGNSGLGGVVPFSSMLDDLNLDSGLAIAGGDAGHAAANNSGITAAPGVYLPFLHDPDQTRAWIHGGIALFAVPAKAIVEARYGHRIRHSYFDGCSTGGAQGYALAQFHPTLFDGINASSPGNYYSHLALSFLWNHLKTSIPGSFMPQVQLTAMTNAVVAACDGEDGVQDGVIADPPKCHFDIELFACKSANASLNSTSCLNDKQLLAAKMIYQGPIRADNDSQIYAGFALGSETSWGFQESFVASAFAIPLLQNLFFDNLRYNATTCNFASDMDLVDAKAGRFIDAINPDLQMYQKRGEKLLSVQVWANQFNSPFWAIQHKSELESSFGGSIDAWFALFMAPGAGHCGANLAYPDAPAAYASTVAMVRWVEEGKRPTQLKASMPPSGANLTRKLCPYPEVAGYSEGDPDDWRSFECDSK